MVSSQHEEMTDLISKKEILERFKISYGQFYRWKRKGLIPEAWFIRKSTFTGQETFLPREKINERIETIMDLKAKHSLEEILDLLSPESAATTFDSEDLSKRVLTSGVIGRFQSITGHSEPFSFRDVVRMKILEELDEFSLASDEIELVLRTLEDEHLEIDETEIDWTLWIVHKGKQQGICCIGPKSKVQFDPDTETAAQIDLGELMEQTRLSLRRL